MPYPSAGIIRAARRRMDNALSDSCSIIRVTRTPNDSGGWRETTQVMGIEDCRIGPAGGRERVAGGKIAEEADLVLTLAHDADVRWDDRIAHGDDIFEVSAIDDRTDRLVRRVYLKRTS